MPDWTGKTLWMALEQAIQRQGDREACSFPNGRLSLPELRRRADEVSRGFLALGAGRGDRVAIWILAYVELKDGAATSETDLIDFCRAGLASFKVPREVRFVSECPMSGTGKIQRFLLKEEAYALR